MSPRSTEFLDGARRRLRAARSAMAEDPASAVSLAYYAMLYACRAALSERELYAKTHSGAWHLFHDTFVATGAFDPELAAAARRQRHAREQADYEAWQPTPDGAEEVVQVAERFLGAIEAMFA